MSNRAWGCILGSYWHCSCTSCKRWCSSTASWYHITTGSSSDHQALPESWTVSWGATIGCSQRAIICFVLFHRRVGNFYGLSCDLSSLLSLGNGVSLSLLFLSLSQDLIGLKRLILVGDSCGIFVELFLLSLFVFADLVLLLTIVIRLLELSAHVNDTSIVVPLVLRLANDEGQLDAGGYTEVAHCLTLSLHLDLGGGLIGISTVVLSLLLLACHFSNGQLQSKRNLFALVEHLVPKRGLHGVVHARGGLLELLDLLALLCIVQVLDFVLHELGVVQLVEQVDCVAHGGASGADGSVELIHRAGD